MTSNKVQIRYTLGVWSQVEVLFKFIKIGWNYQNRARNSEFTIRLPLGQIGQGQTPFMSAVMFWVWPIIILLVSTALVFLGCPKLI